MLRFGSVFKPLIVRVEERGGEKVGDRLLGIVRGFEVSKLSKSERGRC